MYSLEPVLQGILEIEEIPEKTKKFLKAKECIDNIEYFGEVVEYCYHPNKQYHTKTIGKEGLTLGRRNIAGITPRDIFEQLDYLADKGSCSDDDRVALSLLCLDEPTIEVVKRIVNKSLRCGVGVDVWAILIPEVQKYSVMLAQHDLPKFIRKAGSFTNIAVSEKFDGVRCQAIVLNNSEIRYVSRTGKPYPDFQIFTEEILANIAYLRLPYPITLDGEVLMEGAKKGEIPARGADDVAKSSYKFVIFDVVEAGFYNQPGTLVERQSILSRAFHILPIRTQHNFFPNDNTRVFRAQHYTAAITTNQGLTGITTVSGIKALAKEIITLGGEGLVLKTWDGEYDAGKSSYRSSLWCKIKAIYLDDAGVEVDLPVKRVVAGKGKYSEVMGKLVCDFNGVEVSVGGGFTDEQRKEFMLNTPKYIEVYAECVTKDGSLRHPQFQRTREDLE